MTDTEVKAELTEFHVIGLTIWGEARGEPIEGKVFVGSVIRNRVLNPRRFGDTYDKVCLARAQFSCWFAYGGKANYDALMQMARAFAGVSARDGLPKDARLEECLFVAEGIIGGQLLDRAAGANHYLTKALLKAAPPAWAKGRTPVVECGSHIGFKL